MRTSLVAAGLIVVAGLVAVVWLWPEPGPGSLPGRDAAAKQVAAVAGPAARGPRPIGASVEGGQVPQDTKPAIDDATARLQGEPVSQQGKVALDTREEPTFTHLVSGRDVPDDIAAATNMSAAERIVVANAQRDEDRRIAGALREFAKTLHDFKPSADAQQVADGYTWLKTVTAHQELFLEMAPFFQNMDDDTQRRFVEERRPWTEFFQEDSLVIRLAKTMHRVRATTYAAMAKDGVDTDTLDKLRARYLLPGHFRYPGNDRFDFGPSLVSGK